MDNITNFKSSSVVEQMIKNAGLEIIASDIYRIKDDFPESKDVSTAVAYVAKKK